MSEDLIKPENSQLNLHRKTTGGCNYWRCSTRVWTYK